MNRVALVVGLLNGRSDLLREIMAKSGCREIRFSTPEYWLYSLNGLIPGAVVLSDSVEQVDRDRIAGEVVEKWSSSCLHLIDGNDMSSSAVTRRPQLAYGDDG